MNHFLPSTDTLWYTPTSMDHHHHHHQHPHQKTLPFFYNSSLCLSSSFKYDDVDSDNSSSNNNTTPTTTATVNAVDRSETTSSSPSSVDHEYMFEKPLTPSDVGKLNRLVIPKQHAEKYFPLAAAESAAATADKSGTAAVGGGGVLLGFEDESGKCWKFRYSYWNSSQSYVLTKGWSRYVKEKKLDAGDVVLFQRHRFESDRFFIGWRRRGSAPAHTPAAASHPASVHNNNNNQNYGAILQSQGYNNAGASHQHQMSSFNSYRPSDCLHAGREVRQGGEKGRGGNAKRVRLFGVNLECQTEEEEEEEPQTSDGSSLSSQGGGQGQYQGGSGSGFAVGPSAYNYFDYVGYPPNQHYNSHMDMNFPQDVNQMRNRLR